MVEAHAASSTLPYVYISGDQTHVRTWARCSWPRRRPARSPRKASSTSYAKPPAPRLMLDSSNLAFGGIFAGNTLDKSFMVSAYKDATGTITITAPAGYTVSTNGADFGPAATITADASFVGSVVTVRFAPTDSVAYNGDLTVAHSSLTPDYGNTVPNATAGTISLTGNGKMRSPARRPRRPGRCSRARRSSSTR